jgi:hypothetical protein
MGGGTVLIATNGSFYVAQAYPNELSPGYENAAVNITSNNIAIAGAGKTNTVLVGYNRATTFFALGWELSVTSTNVVQCKNFVLRDITLEARPNWAVSNISNSTNIVPDTNSFVMASSGGINDQNTNLHNGFEAGALVIFAGPNPYTYNILVTNCAFLYGYQQLNIWNTSVSNVLVTACDFLWSSNAVFGNVGFFGQGYNFVVISNTFNGNTNLAPASFAEISTNLYYNGVIAGVGLAWFEYGGNWFVGGNTILNNLFEGVQVNNGPSSIAGNTYSTFTSSGSGCALDAYGTDTTYSPTGAITDNATCFVGNAIYGGRQGVEASAGIVAYTLNCSGNSFTLYPAYDEAGEWPGSAVQVQDCQSANVCGNTLTNGGYGFGFSGGCSNALILNNNFSGATYRGIGYGPAGGYLNTAQIFGNTLCEGVSFHIQLTYTNSFGWFLGQNTNVNANLSIIPLFTDPASSAVHIFN